jgi:mannose-6-phosphate isomerase-like protein (cupin superfamily)
MSDNQVEIWLITSGTADLVVGGTIVEPYHLRPGNTRGKSISGGTTKKVAAGDLFLIPAKTPHQVLTRGKSFTFLEITGDSK